MIQEDYVSFETAKLLKEKWFKSNDCHTAYDENGQFFWYGDYSNDRKGVVDAPTLQMAMKWLRQVHHIFIQVELYSKYDDYCFEVFQNTHRLILEKHETYNNYEEACDAAIKYCIENLI